ncbi:putative protein PGR [Paratrimastix pyriformis]|uniref:Transmembrane protein 19 n=1 Tax=Paratrimastix pyriformis TaxID=342808 RepID=A0ABQ8UCG1_9EUKA|nr:putative protein PGR [Paratrimastix pyriformis]
MSATTLFVASFIAFVFSYYGYRKNTLAFSGAVMAFLCGTTVFSTNPRFGVTMIVVFLAVHFASKLDQTRKAREVEEISHGRNWMQILCTNLTAVIASVLYYLFFGDELMTIFPRYLGDLRMARLSAYLQGLYLGHFSCAAADTFGSEIGVLASGFPRLSLPPFPRVPPGTNGGMTLVGTISGVFGAILVGISHVMLTVFLRGLPTGFEMAYVILSCAVAGTLGSIIDSVLGASLQFSGWDPSRGQVVNNPGAGVAHISGRHVLTNPQVNFISSLATGLLLGAHWATLQ